MPAYRCRCHIQDSINNFVAVSIVWECCIVAVGPFTLFRSWNMVGRGNFFGVLGCHRHACTAFLAYAIDRWVARIHAAPHLHTLLLCIRREGILCLSPLKLYHKPHSEALLIMLCFF